jgi:hypothetical protein
LDVHDHFATRERECRELSLGPDPCFADLCAEEEGSGGQRGIFWGHLVMTDDYYLDVFEYLEVDDGGAVQVEKYSYCSLFPPPGTTTYGDPH